MKKKTERGRPRQTTRTKSMSVLLRLTPEEKTGFTDAANVAGLSLAAWMRERLRRAATRDLEDVGKLPKFLED